MRNRLEMVLTKEEMARVAFNGENITVDLHGLVPKAAERLVKNIMALDREGYDICTIHGYNHGTALKSMITGNIKNPRLEKKVPVKGNYGRTLLKMQAA